MNKYLAEHGGIAVTAKTFRTWNATVLAAEEFARAAEDGVEPTAAAVNEIVDGAPDELGNTRAVCRNSYVHPAVVAAFVDQTLMAQWHRPVRAHAPAGLTVGTRVVRLLKST